MTDNPIALSHPQAEAATLGSVLVDGQVIFRIKGLLQPEDFTEERHRQIYTAMLELAHKGMAIDLVTVAEQLENGERLAEAGGPGYLTGLISDAPTYIHAESYALIVARLAQRRALLATAQQIASDAYKVHEIDTVLDSSRKRLAAIERSAQASNEGMNLPQSITHYLDLLERRNAERDKPRLAFPWQDLADFMPFLDSGTLAAIVAEPGVGKTAFLENCAEEWARRGWKVMFFHYELSTDMMLDRRMQRETGLPIKSLQTGGQMEGSDYSIILAASERMNAWTGNIEYVHCPGWAMARVVNSIWQAFDLGGVDVAIVDYLNKVKMVDRHGMTSAQLRGQDIEDFKVCLEELGIVGMMAAQFDKASKSLRFRSLANARDTGELEDKANVGIVIDRPRDESGERTSNARVSVVKCTAGREGLCEMYFEGKRLKFIPLSRRPVDELLSQPWDKE